MAWYSLLKGRGSMALGEVSAAEVFEEVWANAGEIDGETAALGLRPATEAELLAGMLCVDSVLLREAEIERATQTVAKQILRDEFQRYAEEGEDYREPVIVGLLNGGVPFAVDLVQEISRYVIPVEGKDRPFHLDLDLVFINPSMYEDEMVPGEPKFSKGYTDKELVRLSGRHIIYADDGSDLGGTLTYTVEETKRQLTGTVNLPVKEEGVVVEVKEQQLEKPASSRTAVLWVKPDSTVQPNYVGVHIGRPWINGYGCNTMVDGGDSVGRNIRFIAESANQPK